MSKIYVLVDKPGYGGEQIMGVFSSKEKAELAIKINARYDMFGSKAIKEYEVDVMLLEMKSDLKMDIEEYKDSMNLLDEINKIMSE